MQQPVHPLLLMAAHLISRDKGVQSEALDGNLRHRFMVEANPGPLRGLNQELLMELCLDRLKV